jgi:Undecaprenyl-phosphate glucose phosphotransferase
MFHSPNNDGLGGAASNLKAAVLARTMERPAPGLLSFGLPWLPFNFIQPLAVAGDFFVILLASVLTGMGYHWFFLNSLGDINTFVALGALVCANFCAFTGTRQNYSPANLMNLARQVRHVTLSWVVIFALLTMVAFTLKISAHFSRGWMLTFFVTGGVSLVAFRTFLAGTLTEASQTGAFLQQKYILITDKDQAVNSFVLAELYRCGYRQARTVEISLSELESASACGSLAKKVRDLATANQTDPIDRIFLMMNWARSREISNVLHLLRTLPLPVYLLPDEYAATFLTGQLETIGSALTIPLQRPPLTGLEQTVKRFCDVLIAAVMIVVLSPLMLMMALTIKMDSNGPVLFKQRRLGFGGSAFFIYKFRTMHVLEDGEHIPQAKRNDPRITPLGRWLRQTSIDELAQLFNVLRGEMSIVGPRPHAVAHDDQYQEVVANYAFRQHVKPGITGWAQINGFRGETPSIEIMAKRIENDLWYINHWSLWLDLKILLKTLFVAIRQPMAY